MASKLKKFGLAIGIIALLLLIAGFFVNPYLENKIESALQQSFPKDYQLEYNNISASVWLGNLSFSEIKLKKEESILKIDAIHLKGISWFDYLETKLFTFNKLELIQPDFRFVENSRFFNTESKSDSLKPKQPKLIIDNIVVDNGQITKLDSTVTTSKLHLSNINLQLKGFSVDSVSSRSKIPFKYSSVNLNIDSISTLVGAFEILHSKNIEINDEKLSFENIEFKTKYTKQEYHQLLKKERDHYDVYAEDIQFEGWNYSIKNDSLTITINSLNLERPNAFITRNKLLEDDNSRKQFFGKALRSLPFYLEIQKLNINNAELKYKENVISDQPPGELNFSKINAEVANISNLNKNEPTTVKIKSQFMNSADLNIDWQFWVNDINEKFTFRAKLDQLPAEKINSFTKPNLKVGFTGNIIQTYFNIYGNKFSSDIDMQMEFDNFKIELLQKDGRKKSTIKSAIANIFIPKKSHHKEEKFKKVNANAKPDRSKSFFNYIWINLKNALLETFGVSK
jgi:hypothetical protein